MDIRGSYKTFYLPFLLVRLLGVAVLIFVATRPIGIALKESLIGGFVAWIPWVVLLGFIINIVWTLFKAPRSIDVNSDSLTLNTPGGPIEIPFREITKIARKYFKYEIYFSESKTFMLSLREFKEGDIFKYLKEEKGIRVYTPDETSIGS